LKIETKGDLGTGTDAIGARMIVIGEQKSRKAGGLWQIIRCLMGYYLQPALSNVGRVDFEEERESMEA
jgi:hypothetical protein